MLFSPSKTYSSWVVTLLKFAMRKSNYIDSISPFPKCFLDEHGKVWNYHPVFQSFCFQQSLEGFSTFQIHPSQMKWTCFTKPPLTTTSECLHSNDQTSEAESEKEGTWKINVDKETPPSIKEIHPECKSTLSGGNLEEIRLTSWGW